MIYCGIDVGKDGAMVFIYGDKENDIDLNPIPLVNKEIDIAALRNILEMWPKEELLVGIENVHSIHGSSAGANFEFGRSSGIVEGLVEGLGLRYVKVSPKKWQKTIHEGVNKTDDIKAMSHQAMKRLYPNADFRKSMRCTKFHTGIVDALCIATWCKITYK